MLHFNPQTGFYPDDIETVREDVREAWIKAFRKDGLPDLNTEPETPAGQIIDSQTASIVDKDNELAFLASMFDPRTAQGIWQDALGYIYFLTRKQAQPTVVTCQLTGLSGTVIPSGAVVQTATGIRLICTESVTIGEDNTAETTFRTENSGPIDVPAQTVRQIVTVIPGWDSVDNKNAGVTGNDVESQATFEDRRYASVAFNARSVASAVYARIGQLNGVIDLVVRQNRGDEEIVIDTVTLSPHSIFVSVLGGDNDEIAKAMYNSVSAGCDYNGNTSVVVTDDITGAQETVLFTRPENMRIGVYVTLKKNNQTANNAEELIKNAVVANFYGESVDACNTVARVHMGEDLYASRFYPSILAQGLTEIETIQLADLTTSPERADKVNFLHIPIDKSPTLDANDVFVTINE